MRTSTTVSTHFTPTFLIPLQSGKTAYSLIIELNDKLFTQELTSQTQSVDCQSLEFTQKAPAQIQDVEKTVSAIYRTGIREIEKIFLNSPVARINWASQMVILDGSLPLGIGY